MAFIRDYLLIIVWLAAVSICLGFKEGEITELNRRPIIGVISEATHGKKYPRFGQSYIAASYVKFLESSGARVVPIMNDLSQSEIEKLFSSINGVLFPGGGVNLTTSGYARVGKIIFNLAKVSFDKGDYFPIWATCLGLEFLSTLISGDANILSNTDSSNLPLPLTFSQDYRNSKLFGRIPDFLAHYLSTAATTMNNHKHSLLTSTFEQNEKLNSFFKVLSTNKDRNGLEFVSTLEGNKYPIFATQWHPEKNSFEWSSKENIPHQEMSIKVTQYMSNFFVNQARLNHHKFSSTEEEAEALIYNFAPVYTGNISGFEQCYFFKSQQDVLV